MLLALVTLAGSARAQAAHSEASPPPAENIAGLCVAVSVNASGEDRRKLEELLTQLFAELSLRVSWVVDPSLGGLPRRSDDPKLFARVYVDLSEPGNAVVRFSHGQSDRIFERRFSLSEGLDAVALEQIGLVMRSSLEYLRADRARQRQETEKLSKAAPGPQHREAWWLGLRYSVRMLAAEVFSQGPGLNLARHVGRLSVTAGAEGTWPVRIGDDREGALISSLGGRASVAYRLNESTAWIMSSCLGAVVEFSRVAPTDFDQQSLDADTRATTRPSFWAFDPTLRSTFALERPLGRWSFHVELGADFRLVRADYVIENQGRTELVFSPWRVPPYAAVWLDYRL